MQINFNVKKHFKNVKRKRIDVEQRILLCRILRLRRVALRQISYSPQCDKNFFFYGKDTFTL